MALISNYYGSLRAFVSSTTHSFLRLAHKLAGKKYMRDQFTYQDLVQEHQYLRNWEAQEGVTKILGGGIAAATHRSAPQTLILSCVTAFWGIKDFFWGREKHNLTEYQKLDVQTRAMQWRSDAMLGEWN